MSLPINWSPATKDEFADLLNYVETSFGVDAALRLLDTTEKVLDGISEHPMLFLLPKSRPLSAKPLSQNRLPFYIGLLQTRYNYCIFGIIEETPICWNSEIEFDQFIEIKQGPAPAGRFPKS
ncbi:MAG: type II toxin-antitoxin system RelE/ParE family toxin [Saprospiraceae bacterium]|nr:type II toxin-antitoxin system RelE/ParE family toxin [Saprospiraceae bacterium]